MGDIGCVGQHHGHGQHPHQGQHHMHGDYLVIGLPDYLVSVNTEDKEAEHDGVAGEVLKEMFLTKLKKKILTKIFFFRDVLKKPGLFRGAFKKKKTTKFWTCGKII